MSDLPAIHDVIVAAYGKYLTCMDRPPAPMRRDYTAAIDAGEIWVIGKPVMGIISLVPTDDSLLIENVAVHPRAQGTGRGRLLMEFAELQARRLNLGRLTLYTNEVMTENLAIYAHLGYVETDRRTDGGYQRIFMQKSLPPSE